MAVAAPAVATEQRGRTWRTDPPVAVGVLLLAPALVLLLLFFVLPILRIFWVALTDPTLSLDRFGEFFASPAARRSLLTTLRVSAIVTVLATLVGLVVAWELRTTTSRWK